MQIVPALAQLELPYLRFACEARGLDELCAIDREIDAWKLAQEAREASAQSAVGGSRRCARSRMPASSPNLQKPSRTVARAGIISSSARSRCVLEAFHLPRRSRHIFYQALAAICAAALKLIRIGQDGSSAFCAQ